MRRCGVLQVSRINRCSRESGALKKAVGVGGGAAMQVDNPAEEQRRTTGDHRWGRCGCVAVKVVVAEERAVHPQLNHTC